MVLRNAYLHTFLDDRYDRHLDPRPMPHHHPLPALLLLPRRLRQEPVLAAHHHFPLLRPSLAGPFIPCILPPAVFTLAGGVEWTEPGAVQLAVVVRDGVTVGVESVAEYPVLGQCAVQLAGLHLEQEEPGNQAQLFGLVGLYGAVFAVGVDGVQSGVAWDSAQG